MQQVGSADGQPGSSASGLWAGLVTKYRRKLFVSGLGSRPDKRTNEPLDFSKSRKIS